MNAMGVAECNIISDISIPAKDFLIKLQDKITISIVNFECFAVLTLHSLIHSFVSDFLFLYTSFLKKLKVRTDYY